MQDFSKFIVCPPFTPLPGMEIEMEISEAWEQPRYNNKAPGKE
jgi:hypothetical protein